MGDRSSGLRDDDFFALGNPIEELNNVCDGFGKCDVGNHGSPRDGGLYCSKMTFGIENGECKMWKTSLQSSIRSRLIAKKSTGSTIEMLS